MAEKPRPRKRQTPTQSAKRPAHARRRPPARAALTEALDAAVAEGEATVPASSGAKLKVTVDVDTNHLTPYAIGWDGDLIIDGLRPASATVPVRAGRHVLSWSFLHKFETKWHHTVTMTLGAGPSQVVDAKSSDKGDDPNSAGTVIVDA